MWEPDQSEVGLLKDWNLSQKHMKKNIVPWKPPLCSPPSLLQGQEWMGKSQQTPSVEDNSPSYSKVSKLPQAYVQLGLCRVLQEESTYSWRPGMIEHVLLCKSVISWRPEFDVRNHCRGSLLPYSLGHNLSIKPTVYWFSNSPKPM